jgi:NitT/TauT family transport system substrate-binding protein
MACVIRRLGLASAIAALALAMAACGGSGGGSPPKAAGGQTVLKVQETAGVPSAFVAFGMQKGFFARHGLKLSLQSSQGGAATLPALVSNKIQVAGSNVVSLLVAASKKLPIEAIAPGTSANARGSRDFGALMVAKGSPIRSVRDLAGKTIAINTLHNIAEVVVKASLQKAGVDPKGVKLAEVDFPDMAPALDKHQVDAAFLIEPFVTIARQAGDRIVDYSYVTTESGMQVGAYAVTRQFASRNADVVRRYRAAVGDTARYLDAHPDEFRSFLSQQAKTPAKLARTMVLPHFTTALNQASLQRTAGLVQRFGLTTGPVKVGDLVGGGA